MMRPRTWIFLCIFAAALLTGAGMYAGIAQQPAVKPATPPPAPPAYTPPDWQEVLAGKAPLRLLVVSKKTMLAWKCDGAVTISNVADGVTVHTTQPGDTVGIVHVAETGAYSLRAHSTNFCPVNGPVRLESEQPITLWSPAPDIWTSYTDPIVITPTAEGAFSVAVELPMEAYLRNVVQGEMPSSFHPQALRAQAIIARTYALAKLGRHADEGADLCATVHCQAYTPGKHAKAAEEAVAATHGLILLYGDKLAETYYHASCGGATDDAGYVWGPEFTRPYLQCTPDTSGKLAAKRDIKAILADEDVYCNGAGNLRWTKHFTMDEVNALVKKNLPVVTGDPTAQISAVTMMTVERRTPGGRAATLRIEGNGMSVLVYGDQIRWLFGTGAPGPDGLWSTLFELTPGKDAQGNITGYQFRGAGRGHGIGLCQWGAEGRARAGQSYRDILHAYYPGTRLSDEKTTP